MPSKKPRDYLADILSNIDLANEFVSGQSLSEFERDIQKIYAVVRCLEIISEASRRLPASLKHRYPDIAWRDVAGAGNVYRHDYYDVSPALIWDTLNRYLPLLRRAVEIELARQSG